MDHGIAGKISATDKSVENWQGNQEGDASNMQTHNLAPGGMIPLEAL
jgi:hypothetical protein